MQFGFDLFVFGYIGEKVVLGHVAILFVVRLSRLIQISRPRCWDRCGSGCRAVVWGISGRCGKWVRVVVSMGVF